MKKYTFIFFIGFLSIHFDIKAQIPYISWEHNFPLPALIMNLNQKQDNSILYAGRTSPDGLTSCFGDSPLVNIWLGNSNGSKTSFSDYCFSEEDSTNSTGIKVIEESDSLYDVFGYTTDTTLFVAKNHSNQGTSDIFYMKVNSSGIIRLSKLYGSAGDELLSSVQKTKDGGWIIGATSDDSGYDVPSHFGSTTFLQEPDAWIVKLDSTGTIQWSDVIGGTGDDGFPQVIQGNDGYFYVCSYSTSKDYDLSNANPNNLTNAFVAKINSLGVIEYINIFGGQGIGGAENRTAALTKLQNGRLIFSGYSSATVAAGADSISHGYDDLWVVELDTSLNPIWFHDYGTSEDEVTSSTDNMLMPDGSMLVAGVHNFSDIYIIKIDTSDGHLLWSDSIIGNGETYIQDGVVLSNNDIMLCGYSNANIGAFGDTGEYHSFLIEISNVTGIPPSPIVQEDYNLSVYPNPFSQSATLKLDNGNRQHWQFTLQDLLGRTVAKYTNDGQISLTISRSNLPAGLYIGIAKDDEGNMLGKTKIVVQ